SGDSSRRSTTWPTSHASNRLCRGVVIPEAEPVSRSGAAPYAQVAVGVGISAACLFIAFRSVDLSSLVASLKTANYWWLLAYPVIATLLNVIRAEIWRRLLGNRAGKSEAFWAYSVGFLVNNVLPLRMGEA